MNRKTRTLLPEKSSQLQPSIPEKVPSKAIKSDTVRNLPERYMDRIKGNIIERPTRACIVLNENGNVLRRNQRYRRKRT
ncbi:hypothetical protein MAR_014779 [Mya arenaria]|uniref:Uncharacterized protein n=1 Tax=Mya arenaria TaxID=6604 RepID=A0ABY7FFE9_MYAAR|nr:hypothetical protein MAR_014779 [Mya arenaria]